MKVKSHVSEFSKRPKKDKNGHRFDFKFVRIILGSRRPLVVNSVQCGHKLIGDLGGHLGSSTMVGCLLGS